MVILLKGFSFRFVLCALVGFFFFNRMFKIRTERLAHAVHIILLFRLVFHFLFCHILKLESPLMSVEQIGIISDSLFFVKILI